MKTFKYGKIEKCYFSVGHYNKENAIGITVVEEETGEDITTLTELDDNYDYEIGLATIYNGNVVGDEVVGYKTGTQVLQDLGIIDEIWTTYDLDNDGINSIPIASCRINLRVLKEYSKEWNYYGYKP